MSTINIPNLADRLKSARKKAKLTQKELSERADVTQQVISFLENGKSKDSRFLVNIALALKVSPTWLAKGEGEMKPDNLSIAEERATYTQFEKQLIEITNDLNDEQMDDLIALAQHMATKNKQ